MTTASQGRACLAAALAVLLASLGHAQAPVPTPTQEAPDFRVQVFGYVVEDFSARLDAYMALRRTLEEGLPPLTVTDNPAEIERAEVALAKRIRDAREDRPGQIFTRPIRAEFRRVILLEMDRHTLSAINGDNPGAFSHEINGAYRKEHPVSTVPPNILALLPQLPDDIQYRFLGKHLVLHDIRANVILDRISCAIRCS